MDKFPFIQKTIDFTKSEGELIGGSLIAYSLLVLFISLILDWVEVVDRYEDVIFYALGIPFLSWLAIMFSTIVFMIPVDAINRYYKNRRLGLDTLDSAWQAVKPVIIWTTILILALYIF